MSDHLEFDDLVAVYAVDALEADESTRFEAHLADCRVCTRKLTEYREVAGRLAAMAGERRPRPTLKTRVMHAVDALPGRGASAHPALLWPAAAAIAVLLVAVSALAVFLYRADARADRAAVSSAYSYDALALLARADQRWEVTGTADAPGTRGVVGVVSTRQQAVLVLWDVEDQPGSRLNAWTRVGEKRVGAGAMWRENDGFWQIIKVPPEGLRSVGVTRVSADGATRLDLVDFTVPR